MPGLAKVFLINDGIDMLDLYRMHLQASRHAPGTVQQRIYHMERLRLRHRDLSAVTARDLEADLARMHGRGLAVSKAIKDDMTRAGVVGTPHQLRHWFGTTLANRGVDLGVVQLLMRHESPATTTIYAQIRMDRQEAGLKMLGLPPAA